MKKSLFKHLAIIIAIATMLSTVYSVVLAEETKQNSASLSLTSASGNPGDTINISLNLGSNTGINSLEIRLSASGPFTIISASGAGALPGYSGNGALHLWTTPGDNNSTGTGTLLNISLKLNDGAENYGTSGTVTASVVQCIDSNGKAVAISSVSSTINIKECAHENMTETVVAEATCDIPGQKKLSCSKCGYHEFVEIPAIGHKWEEKFTWEKAPTCTEAGVGGVKKCLNDSSHTLEASAEESKALGHTWSTEKKVIEEATCTEDGLKAFVCTVCGELQTGSEEVIPASHDWDKKHTVIKKPTCTTGGKEAIKCSKCDELKGERTIPAAHNFTKEVISSKTLKTPAKDGKPAVYYYTCAICGEISKIATFTSDKSISTDIEYKVVEGNGIAIKTELEEDYSIIVNAEFDLFKDLMIDNKILADINYIAEEVKGEDKTKITIKFDFIKTLDEGVHDLLVSFTDGTASSNFIIKKLETSTSSEELSSDDISSSASSKPSSLSSSSDEDDSSVQIFNIILYCLIAFAVIIVVVLIVIIVKKMKAND